MTMSEAEKTIETLTKSFFNLGRGDLRGARQQRVEWLTGLIDDPQIQMVRFRGRVTEEMRNWRRTGK